MSSHTVLVAGAASSLEGPAVPLLRWPDEEQLRRRLADQGAPRLLLVPDGVDAPVPLDELEDWVRDPADPADLVARIAALQQRARRVDDQPHLDEDGLLWLGTRWVVIPDGQRRVAELLLARANRLVRTEVLTHVYVAGGGSGHRATIRTMLNRLATRFSEVGIRLVFVRGKGVVLEVRSR